MPYKFKKIFATILLASLSLAPAVLAENRLISAWHKTDYSQARAHILQANEQNVSLAVEINIIENYKTYWMSPGSTGVPPLADIMGKNIVQDSAKISFPWPHKYIDKYGETWGYKDRVVLFINVDRNQTTQNTELDIAFDYAVCDQICLPEHAQFKLKLDAGNLAKTMSALKFGTFSKQISQEIKPQNSAIISASLTTSQQLVLNLNTELNDDLFITDNHHRFYQHSATDSNQKTYNLHGMAVKNADKQLALTIHYATSDGYFHTKIQTK
ncbi:MAG: hypothetical protein COC24_010920 [Alphaproteobacteria bacterium]|nr:hypothetical protein [Alphaproteobacteria bacterium]